VSVNPARLVCLALGFVPLVPPLTPQEKQALVGAGWARELPGGLGLCVTAEGRTQVMDWAMAGARITRSCALSPTDSPTRDLFGE
jgi:hypothetical protein